MRKKNEIIEGGLTRSQAESLQTDLAKTLKNTGQHKTHRVGVEKSSNSPQSYYVYVVKI